MKRERETHPLLDEGRIFSIQGVKCHMVAIKTQSVASSNKSAVQLI